MAVPTMDDDRADKVILNLQTIYGPWEPCQQYLAKPSLMGAALPHRLCNNRLATQTFKLCTNGTIIGMCASCVALTLRMATRPSLAP